MDRISKVNEVNVSMGVAGPSFIAASRLTCATVVHLSVLAIAVAAFQAPFAAAQDGPQARPDWKAKFVAEEPLECAKLQAAVSELETRSTGVWTHYPGSHSGPDAPPLVDVSTGTLKFDLSQHGMMVKESPVPSDKNPLPGALVWGCDDRYRFSIVRSGTGPYHIDRFTRFGPQLPFDAAWKEQLLIGYLPAAAMIDELWVSGYIDGTLATVKDASEVVVNGKKLIRVDFDRRYPHTHVVYPSSALFDPNFHWAVVSFEEHFATGFDTGVLEYQADIAEFAFPRRYIEKELSLDGKVRVVLDITYDKPHRTQAQPRDFTLEAFGLEQPLSGETPAPPPTTSPSAPAMPTPVNGIAAPSASKSAETAPGPHSASNAGPLSDPGGDSAINLVLRQWSMSVAVSATAVGVISYAVYLLSTGRQRRRGQRRRDHS